MRHHDHNQGQSRKAFSLVEILVVLAIAAILSSLTLGGYAAMRASNYRTTCQAQMSQIYQAIRLYSADYDGNVPYYDPNNTLGNGTGLGLWALYTYSQPGSANKPAAQGLKLDSRYLKSAKTFHCPADKAGNDDQMYLSDGTFNPKYLSYQPAKDISFTPVADSGSGGEFQYNPIRSTNLSGAGWRRQLLHYDGSTLISRPPADNTVVFWCPFHRTGPGGGDRDNVLFWDGTVQIIPREQVIQTSPTIVVKGWERHPKTP